MAADTLDDLNDTVLGVYENTDAAQLVDVAGRRARITHFMQRTLGAIWYDRAWPFSMNTATLVMSGGSAVRPTDFAGLTGEGGLWDSSGIPWREIGYQEMSVIRARGVETGSGVFNIGETVLIPDKASSASFTLVYQKVAPEITVYGTAQALPVPYGFWEALLLGTVALVKGELGDTRQDWRADYMGALAKQQRLWRGMVTRTTRMPLTVGGMW